MDNPPLIDLRHAIIRRRTDSAFVAGCPWCSAGKVFGMLIVGDKFLCLLCEARGYIRGFGEGIAILERSGEVELHFIKLEAAMNGSRPN